MTAKMRPTKAISAKGRVKTVTSELVGAGVEEEEGATGEGVGATGVAAVVGGAMGVAEGTSAGEVEKTSLRPGKAASRAAMEV